MNNSFELCKNLYLEIQIAQMNYSWACLRLPLLSFVGLLLSYFVVGFISWSNRMTGSCTKMFLTTLRATMTPQTPIPASNPILASMPNIYLSLININPLSHKFLISLFFSFLLKYLDITLYSYFHWKILNLFFHLNKSLPIHSPCILV